MKKGVWLSCNKLLNPEHFYVWVYLSLPIGIIFTPKKLFNIYLHIFSIWIVQQKCNFHVGSRNSAVSETSLKILIGAFQWFLVNTKQLSGIDKSCVGLFTLVGAVV